MSIKEGDPVIEKVKEKNEEEFDEPLAHTAPQPSTRELSVQDRIILFENKQKQSGDVSLQKKETVKKVQRQSKRNQELNETLIIKAAELEKLFAQHKLRVLEHQAPRLTYKKQVLNSRGKLYDSYVKNREARLTELWDLNKATMKSMHDSLAKLSWPISNHDSVSVSRHRAERLRLFLKNQKIKDDEGNVSRPLDPKPFVKKRPVKNFSTSTPRTASASVLKSTPKVCNVPNLSYMRKNSMKAYSAARKIAA